MYFFAGLFFASKILSSGCCCSNFYSTKVCSIFCSLMTLSLESCRAPKQLFDDALLLWKKQSVFHLPSFATHLPSCGTFKDVVDYDVDVDAAAAAAANKHHTIVEAFIFNIFLLKIFFKLRHSWVLLLSFEYLIVSFNFRSCYNSMSNFGSIWL